MSRRASSLVLMIACWFLIPRAAQARGVGTDSFLLSRDGKLHWQYACGRFSDWELHVQRKGKEVFASIPCETNPFSHDPLHLYRIYSDMVVTLEGKLLARIRLTERGEEVFPVKDK